MNTNDQDIKYKELTEKIISVFYRVYNKLGYGFLEKVYENAMMIKFRKEGVPAVAQSPIKVLYEEAIVGEYYADILVLSRRLNERSSITSENKDLCISVKIRVLIRGNNT